MTFLLSLLFLLPGCCGRWNSCEKPCKPVCKPKCKPKCPKKCCRKICTYVCGKPKIITVDQDDPRYYEGMEDMDREREMREREMEDINNPYADEYGEDVVR